MLGFAETSTQRASSLLLGYLSWVGSNFVSMLNPLESLTMAMPGAALQRRLCELMNADFDAWASVTTEVLGLGGGAVAGKALSVLGRVAGGVTGLGRSVGVTVESAAGTPGHVLNSSGGLPSTGVPRFDALAVDTPSFSRWLANVEARGYEVIARTLDPGHAGMVDDVARQLVYDPAQFRFVDLLHESRHIRQIERLAASGFQGTRSFVAWFERGAYEFERRLGMRVGFSGEYQQWLGQRIGEFWTPARRTKFQNSATERSSLQGVWR